MVGTCGSACYCHMQGRDMQGRVCNGWTCHVSANHDSWTFPTRFYFFSLRYMISCIVSQENQTVPLFWFGCLKSLKNITINSEPDAVDNCLAETITYTSSADKYQHQLKWPSHLNISFELRYSNWGPWLALTGLGTHYNRNDSLAKYRKTKYRKTKYRIAKYRKQNIESQNIDVA